MVVAGQQPFLHALVSCLSAPALALSGPDGQIRPGSAQGFYYADRRLVDTAEVLVDGVEATAISAVALAADRVRFIGVLPDLGDDIADPTVSLERQRRVHGAEMIETIIVHNRSTDAVRATVSLRCSGDLASVATVKAGHAHPETDGDRPPVHRSEYGTSWGEDDCRVRVRTDPAPHASDDAGVLYWDVVVPAATMWRTVVTVTCSQADTVPFRAPLEPDPHWTSVRVRAGDHRLARLVERGLDDLRALLLSDPEHPSDRFVAAGSPWFLTLFGRDALWAARLLLPVGAELAGSTLRTLARRQGERVDPTRDEEPGKILHEVRRADLGTDLLLPPVYYGTVDATPLWITLLCDAWRWGLAEDEVEALVPHLQRALVWMRDFGDSDGDGFLEYTPHSTAGLANQGWKDSHDSVQWFDGRLACAPIALCEVQGYAYEAASKAAELLDAFGRSGADEWRTWAARLAARFRDAFWVDKGVRPGEDAPYPAIALDRDKARINTVSSNMGHLLGTGILDSEECAVVARRLARGDMDSGWGLRTMTADSPRFNPLSYHGGSVWPHDTAIAMCGLAATGHSEVATSLARGLVDAGEAFGFRLPELYGGHQATLGAAPIAYPAACRPQAWAAASGVAVLAAVLGLRPDVPAGRVGFAPVPGLPFGALDVDGVSIAGARVRIRFDGSTSTIDGLPAGVRADQPQDPDFV